VITSILKELLARKPFKKRLERKPLPDRKLQEGVITSILKKSLSENPSDF